MKRYPVEMIGCPNNEKIPYDNENMSCDNERNILWAVGHKNRNMTSEFGSDTYPNESPK